MSQKAVEFIPPSIDCINCALAYLGEELETLRALAAVLSSWLEVKDMNDLGLHDNPTAYAIANLLDDMLSSTKLERNMRSILEVAK